MNKYLFAALVLIPVTSCRKNKEQYYPFSDRELRFVNYVPGQLIKFTDSSGITHNMTQTVHRRSFVNANNDQNGISELHEDYIVAYHSPLGNQFDFHVQVKKSLYKPSVANFFLAGYSGMVNAAGNYPTGNSIVVNGRTYNDVISFKAYKLPLSGNDTATFYHNQVFGIIQLVFPNGKKIVRTD